MGWIVAAALCAPAGLARPPLAAGDEGLALIHGIIYRTDEVTRLPGAMVTAINVKTGRRYSSVLTGTNGAYEIAGLPAGTYDIAIDTPDDHLYVTDGLIELHENQRLMLSLSLKKNGGAVPGGPSQGEAMQSFTDPGAVPAPPVSPGLEAPAAPEGPAKDPSKKSSKTAAPKTPEEKKPSKKPKTGTRPTTGSGATARRDAGPDGFSPFA
jgi:hypothetical protein